MTRPQRQHGRLAGALWVLAVALVAAFAAAGATYGVEQTLQRVLDAPTWVVVVVPAIGLTVNAVVRFYLGPRCSPASTDAYIDAFHGVEEPLRAQGARALGGAATTASGVALDTAGLGAVLGTAIAAAARRMATAAGPAVLVAGAAAGLAAALRSPVAAAVLAVEVPFRSGTAWRRLPAALVGSVAGFVAIGLVDEFRLPFRVDVGVVGVRDVVLALWLAVLAGFAARLVTFVANRAQRGLSPTFGREWHHVVAGASVLVGLAVISFAAFDDVPVSLGAGQLALSWSATASLAGLCAVLVVRAAASAGAVLGRGTGGLLVPLLVMGWIAGHALADLFDGNIGLIAVIGAATLLGGAHRVPLAALVWLVESTHSVPGSLLGGVAVLIAAAAAGGRSVSSAQRAVT